MGNYAKVVDGIVTKVIVAKADFFESFVDDEEGQWIKTSYNTRMGVHDNGGTPLRKNFAGIGYTYDSERDAFIPPKRFSSWILDEDTCCWISPIPYPDDGLTYKWDESVQNWVKDAEKEE